VQRGGKTVLDNLDVEISAGTVTGLLGPSDCGKTTLMRAIVGVQIIAAGRVESSISPPAILSCAVASPT
jgi:ABC-2 type transport system ATP-binding protein